MESARNSIEDMGFATRQAISMVYGVVVMRNSDKNNVCLDCGRTNHFYLVFPNPLCWMFEFQKPEFMWKSHLGCEILWTFHELTCLDTMRVKMWIRIGKSKP